MGSSQLADAAPWAARRLAGFRKRSQGFVRSCLREAAARGLLREGLSPPVAAVLVLGPLVALGQGRLVGERPPPPEEVWEALEGMLRAPTRRGRKRARPRAAAAAPSS
jgi:hypothetical protein